MMPIEFVRIGASTSYDILWSGNLARYLIAYLIVYLITVLRSGEAYGMVRTGRGWRSIQAEFRHRLAKETDTL